MSSTPRIVTEEGSWFLNSRHSHQADRKYEVDYRYAICYSLVNYLRPPGNGQIEEEPGPLLQPDIRRQGREVLKRLRDAINKRAYWEEANFVQVIPFEYEENDVPEKGCVIVDKSDGMYPLVLDLSRGRLNAYQQALDDVLALYENDVYPQLEGQTTENWTKEFQGNTLSKIPWNYQEEASAVGAMGM
jgi:hypothetical protein